MTVMGTTHNIQEKNPFRRAQRYYKLKWDTRVLSLMQVFGMTPNLKKICLGELYLTILWTFNEVMDVCTYESLCSLREEAVQEHSKMKLSLDRCW